MFQKYNSKHNFNSNSKNKQQIYHTSDERVKRSNYSIGSLNDTGDMLPTKEGLTEIKEEGILKDHIQYRNKPFKELDESKTQTLDY